MAVDYRPTVFLPQTDFPMKAELPKREPGLLERWARTGLYERIRAKSKGREKFVLHDGPPYANGNLHMGHALNKILKDIVVRSQQMLGKDSVYVPGWDCHGLPIEWKIEEKYRAAKQNKDDVPIDQFRRECRAFAEHWVDVQRTEFKRLGVMGDWDNPYLTMAYAAEAQIVREIGKFLMNGGLFQGAKPVLWSVVEQTALAEAEVEYQDHTSRTIHVRFKVVTPSVPALAGASVVIWTTTPWTMPGNRAVAYGADFDYAVVRVDAVADGSKAGVGETLVLGAALVEPVAKEVGITGWTVLATLPGSELAGTLTAHPLRGQGYDFDVPLLPGGFVTTDAGTGFVHIAPGHGEDDFLLSQAHGIGVTETVAADGSYVDRVPLFAGKRVYTPYGKPGDANPAVIEALDAAGGLLAAGSLVHSYPHSWRSKAPLIFRTTPQWFISMETNDLRQVALQAISDTRWVPPQGENRIRSMIESRPDWCISRQRAWGVPIAIFVDKKTRQPLRDQRVVDRIAAAVEDEGADVWFTAPAARFLGNDYNPGDYEKVTDIVDVWFDSGSTHSFVLEQRPDLMWPASLYLEGSDQHRGWFHSSLLESCGTRGRAPYDAVLTHGFVLDEQGRKMSKSLGNITAPQDVIEGSGADILRLWVVASDYYEDLRIGKQILGYQVDVYRRLRNTLRYLLGALSGFSAEERIDPAKMPELERWVLHRLKELDIVMREATDAFDFHRMYVELHQFCSVDLSAFYFDIRKDALYCDRPDDPRRRAVRTVMDLVFDCLAKWLAPILCFTAEEAWLARHGSAPDTSVHLEVFPTLPDAWIAPDLAERWSRIRDLRRVVTGAIELERAAKRLGSSLQASVTLFVDSDEVLSGLDLAEICIVSEATLSLAPVPDGAFTMADVPGIAVTVGLAPGEKCQRCWRVLPEVTTVAAHPDLCHRCADAVDHHHA
ncbi:isoleucine--tRNA ligase [Aliidongia dinghuensis]|uniref:Isoleucine--tRNA ligase n=1 Tax=Aliidongia dinghuensis TaxID=1867774 RepID=A0A8J3E360_9PROT|nr:isoleucine--tRNA ligase [Aliidongia dinghuensis]GGF15968.1 isoleucine--tRNA ligase [Aliidongia dinghuensis]